MSYEHKLLTQNCIFFRLQSLKISDVMHQGQKYFANLGTILNDSPMGLLSYLKFFSFGKRDIAPKYMAMKMDITLNV